MSFAADLRHAFRHLLQSPGYTAAGVATLGLVIGAVLLTAAVPLRQVNRTSLLDTLEGERTTAGRATLRARSLFLVAQIALSVVLLVGAGLVLRRFLALTHADLGFSPSRVLSMTVQPGQTVQPPNEWMDAYLARVRSFAGVENAGAVYLRPLMLGPIGQGVAVRLEGSRNRALAPASIRFSTIKSRHTDTSRR